MGKGRMEAFSDGVLAIIITIMVLELKVPPGFGLASLQPLIPVLISYVLSFIYIGIYWTNHHHMIHTCQHVTGGILWANLHLLFWLSLFPFVTNWIGDQILEPVPVSFYGIVLLMAAIAYYILQQRIIASQGEHSVLARAVGNDLKGKLSPVMYAAGIVASWYDVHISHALYVAVAVMWLVPDRRIERAIHQGEAKRV